MSPPKVSGPGTDGRGFSANFLLELFNDPLDPGYTDAADLRALVGPRPPWRRRGAFGLRMILLVVTGFLLAVAYRQAVIALPVQNTAHAGLVNEVKAAQARTDELQRQADDLRRRVGAAQRDVLGGSTDELNRIRRQEAGIGLAAVSGPGVTVRLADAAAPIDPTTGKASTENVNRILDLDLQAVVNALWASGAEAIAINHQRLTATSAIRTAGDAILVDFRPVASPYEISAVGSDELGDRFSHTAAATAMRGLVEQYALGFVVQGQGDLHLPAATGPTLRYAHRPGMPSPSGGTR
jgi:uncharacterized protein YlxW (UPF0749 family)